MVKKETMISIMIPSRGRPTMLDECIKSILQTADNPHNIECVVYLDDDDHSYDLWRHPEGVKVITGKRKKLSEYFSLEGCHGDIYLMANDDVVFRTQGWDTKVLTEFEKIPDKIAVIYGEDGDLNPGKMNATFPFLHRNWIAVIGRLVPPYFSNNFVDTWVSEIADMLGRKIKIDIITEHMHHDFGKRKKDQTDFDKWDRHWLENMPQKFIDTRPEREEEAAKLKKFIEEFK